MKVRLLDGPLTLAQQLIIGAWSATLLGVVALWALTALEPLTQDVASAFLSIGLLVGLLATFFALTQFLLMGRIAWIEKAFGLDRLASYHRLNGYAAIILILAHAPLITASYALRSGTNYFTQYSELLTQYPFVGLAGVAVVLFVIVVGSSIYISRKHLKFETWYYVHLAVYAAIILASLHQFAIGSSFTGNPIAFWSWLSLYLFVALNIIIWRFMLPIINLFRFQFRVDRIVQETPTTTSVYIFARDVKRLRALPGQFVLVRFLSRQFVLEEHPFSLSMIPQGDMIRLTIRHVGDFTSRIASLQPGTRVLVSGPFGRFTHKAAQTNKRLFIAGGVGITPIRSMAEEAVKDKRDAVLLFGNKDRHDVPLRKELEALRVRGLNLRYVYSDQKVAGAERGRIDGDLIERLVPDFLERDIYVCGPPPMMETIVADLKKRNIDEARLHYERFALHN